MLQLFNTSVTGNTAQSYIHNVQMTETGAGINHLNSFSLSPGLFKGSYDLERGLCDLERLD